MLILLALLTLLALLPLLPLLRLFHAALLHCASMPACLTSCPQRAIWSFT